MICGEMNGSRTDLQDAVLFYFLRTTVEGIPYFDSYQECQGEITNYLAVGSLQGKFLLSMNRLLVEVVQLHKILLIEIFIRFVKIMGFLLTLFIRI